MKRVLALFALAACAPDELVLAPVIDSPFEDDDAAVFGSIDALEISIATDGDASDLVKKRFETGEILELPDVPFGSNLVMHLSGIRGQQSAGYGRTCAFAVAPGAELVEPHVFFSQTQKFARVDWYPRTQGQAIDYNGSAIIFGGGSATVEQFDATRGALVADIGVLAPRANGVGALFGASPARIAVFGGVDGGAPLGVVEVFDPQRGVERIEDDTMGRVGLTATSLPDGRVIVVGGNAPSMAPVGTISELTVESSVTKLAAVTTLAFPRTDHTATPIGSDPASPILIAGGTDAVGTVAQAELFKPASGTLADPVTFVIPMKHPRTRHKAVRVSDGSVLILGGVDAAGQPVRALERFTIDEGFVDVLDTARAPVLLDPKIGIVDMTVTVLPEGRLLIAGGRTSATAEPTAAAYLLRFDPKTGTPDILRTDELSTPRANHYATLLCDGTVFFGGGAAADKPAERYNPPPTGRR